MRGFRANDLREDCDGPLIITGGVDVGPYPVPIGGDGRFLIEYDSTGTVGVEPATFHTKIAGLISGSAASGTASLVVLPTESQVESGRSSGASRFGCNPAQRVSDSTRKSNWSRSLTTV